jgi:hypothetical protein
MTTIKKNLKTTETTPINHMSAIQQMVASFHNKAHRIDVKPLWETAWRVNVYEADDGIVKKVTLPYSYFVSLDKDKSLFFNPSLGIECKPRTE